VLLPKQVLAVVVVAMGGYLSLLLRAIVQICYGMLGMSVL